MIASSVGLLILRVVLGLTMAAHGYNKFFGPGGISGTAGWFDSIGMRPGALHARLAAITEIGAGLLLVLGLFTPLASAAFVALMLVAAWTVHRGSGFFITSQGWEYNLVLAGAAVALGATGAGRISLDWLVFHHSALWPYLRGWWGLAIALGLGLIAGIAQLAIFFRPPAKAATT